MYTMRKIEKPPSPDILNLRGYTVAERLVMGKSLPVLSAHPHAGQLFSKWSQTDYLRVSLSPAVLVPLLQCSLPECGCQAQAWFLAAGLEIFSSFSWVLLEAFSRVRAPRGLQGLGSSFSDPLMPRPLSPRHQYTLLCARHLAHWPCLDSCSQAKLRGLTARTVVQLVPHGPYVHSLGPSELSPAHNASLTSPSFI